jgi:hypothetical protein
MATEPSLALIPSSIKASKVYSVLPIDGAGDFDFSRASGATRVNSDGLIEDVANNVPRLDWYNSNCPSLLLEPQRTNLILFSEQFSGANWGTLNTTLTSNTVISPNGTMTANTLQRTSTSASYRSNNISKSASAITYTTSAFIKKGSDNYFSMRAQGSYPSRADFRFRFDTEQIYYTQAFSNFTILDYGVQNYSNGWYRMHFTYTTDPHTNLQIVFSPRATDGNIDSSDTSSTSFAYVWGAQTEVANYVSSYIKTEASPVTRTVDSCKLQPFSGLATDYPLTVYGKIEIQDKFAQFISIGNSTNEFKYLSVSPATGGVNVTRRNTIAYTDFHTFSYSIGDIIKFAIKYTSNTAYKLYINGSLIGNVTSGNDVDFDFDSVLLGQLRNSDTLRNSVHEAMVFNEALTDSELIQLTS